MTEAKVPKSPTSSMVAIMKIINSRHHINNDRHYHHHNAKRRRRCQTDMHSQHCQCTNICDHHPRTKKQQHQHKRTLVLSKCNTRFE